MGAVAKLEDVAWKLDVASVDSRKSSVSSKCFEISFPAGSECWRVVGQEDGGGSRHMSDL